MEVYPTPPKPVTSVSGKINALVGEQLVKWKWHIVFAVLGWIAIFWLIVWWREVAATEDVVGFFVAPFVFAALAFWAIMEWRAREAFWKQFAARHGWSYEPWAKAENETAAMTRQGADRRIDHVVAGQIEGREARIFSYSFYKRNYAQKNNGQTYFYTVFAFKFTGHFPHLYLDRIGNPYSIKLGKQISVPLEFKEKFRLMAPEGYEIEALQIFTPDLLAYILDSSLKHDVELVDQELILYVPGKVDTLEELEKEFSQTLKIVNRFAPVGDRPPVLRS